MSSSVIGVQEALYSALLGDTGVMALLTHNAEYAGIYDGAAPVDAPYDFIVLGSTEESDFGTLGKDGNAAAWGLRIGTRPAANERPGFAKARAIYANVKRVLETPLAVDDVTMYLQRVRLVATLMEQDGKTAVGIVDYSYRTM